MKPHGNMAAGRTQTAADGMTTQQWRGVLADMKKGGTGEEMGFKRAALLDIEQLDI